MKTGNKQDYVYYNWDTNISSHYINGYCVATLEHTTDTFDNHETMTREDMDYSYAEMLKNRNKYFKQ